jgi:hypothetical protein
MTQNAIGSGRPIIDSPELTEAANLLEASLKDGEKAAWRTGLYYNRIIEQKLAEKSGYRHARDFVASRFKHVSQATLSHYGALARAFSEDTAARYGASLLCALLTYEKLTGLQLPQGDPGSVIVQVPGESDPRTFADCNRSEVLKAIQALKKHSGEPMRADEAALLQRLHQALGDDHPIALSSRQGKEGTVVVFTLALREVTSLLEVLERVLKGPEAVKASEEVMKQLADEFGKGIEAWGKTLGTASGPKEPR